MWRDKISKNLNPNIKIVNKKFYNKNLDFYNKNKVGLYWLSLKLKKKKNKSTISLIQLIVKCELVDFSKY